MKLARLKKRSKSTPKLFGALTVIAQTTYEIGRAAFSMLLSRMQLKEGETGQQSDFRLFPAELRIRNSTAPPGLGSAPLPGNLREPLVNSGPAGRVG